MLLDGSCVGFSFLSSEMSRAALAIAVVVNSSLSGTVKGSAAVGIVISPKSFFRSNRQTSYLIVGVRKWRMLSWRAKGRKGPNRLLGAMERHIGAQQTDFYS